MTALFQKLNFKKQSEIVVINHPKSFSGELNEMKLETKIVSSFDKVQKIDFIIIFVKTQNEVNDSVKEIIDKLNGDAILWMCYPKGSSKRYRCDFNRDTGWALLEQHNLETVRQVAIDDDWSALRFRKTEFVKYR